VREYEIRVEFNDMLDNVVLDVRCTRRQAAERHRNGKTGAMPCAVFRLDCGDSPQRLRTTLTRDHRRSGQEAKTRLAVTRETRLAAENCGGKLAESNQ